MQCEHRIMVLDSRHKLFADPLGTEKYSFVEHQYKQMMPEPLLSRPGVCGFYTIYAAFHIFEFRQEKITRINDVDVRLLMSNYM